MSAGHEQGNPERAAPQLRTILLTDLVDSTGLVERLGDVPASELFREHDRLVLELQQRWRGRLIDRSDGLLLLFERAIDGLGFALDYTKGLREIGKARGVPVQARSGLHVGEVLTWKNSDAAVQLGSKPLEVEGLAKPMAARLMTMARPGQILISAMAEPLARRAARELGERGQNLLWKSHGHWRFKGIPQAHEIHEVGEVGIAPLRAPASGGKAWRDIPLWRRPAALVAEVVLLAGIGIGGWMATRSEPAIAFAERDWVVVGDLRNLTGQTVLDESLEQAFRISLEQSRYVNVLSDMKARDTLARMQRPADTPIDRSVASEIAIRDGARAVILPTVSEVGGRLRVSAEVIDPHSQATVYAESSDGTGAGSLLGSIDDVTGVLRERLGEALATVQRDSTPLPQVTTSNLDALRAYALGQAAFAASEWEDARSFYARAVQLDDEFALAYIGLLRAHNAMDDLASGVPHLRKAQARAKHLPPRDQQYLEAWVAEVDAPAEAVNRWRQMSHLYPDYLPAASNTASALYRLNRFEEGALFAKDVARTGYEFQALDQNLVGLLELGMNDYGPAEHAFIKAGPLKMDSASMNLAVAHAAQEQFVQAGVAASRVRPTRDVRFDSVSIALDEGKWQQAREQVAALTEIAQPSANRSRQVLLPAAVVQWAGGDERDALATLDQLVRVTLEAIADPASGATAQDDAYVALSAALLAQRMGRREPAKRVLAALAQRPGLTGFGPLAGLVAVVEANELRLAGKPEESLKRLQNGIKAAPADAAPFQTHFALLQTYLATDQLDKALAEARWLTAQRGRAYSEIGCGWCQQSLNVMDTTLGHLLAAELLVSMSRHDEARAEMEKLDNRWKPAALPDHLRVRRAAVVATFN